MTLQDKMVDKLPEIHFDEWDYKKKKYYKVCLLDFNHGESIHLPHHSGKYYVYEGWFIEDYPEHSMKEKARARFWIGESSWEKAIVRVVDFKKLNQTLKYNITLNMARVSKKRLHIKTLINIKND